MMGWRELLAKTPEANNSWTCRWFLLIVYVCVWMILLGATVIPGTIGVIAMTSAATTLLIVTLLRDGSEGACDT